MPLDLRELEAGVGSGRVGRAGARRRRGGRGSCRPREPIEPPPTTLEGEITDLIERQPDEVAQTLRSWLADRRS